MVIKQPYRVERRGYKNWIVNAIDDKVFVRSIGNFQEHLNCYCGKKICRKCPFRQGLLFFSLWITMYFGWCADLSAVACVWSLQISWRGVPKRAGFWRWLWGFSGWVPFFWRGSSILNPCYELWERSLPDLTGRIRSPDYRVARVGASDPLSV